MVDLVKQLREPVSGESARVMVLWAADEIERLRSALKHHMGCCQTCGGKVIFNPRPSVLVRCQPCAIASEALHAGSGPEGIQGEAGPVTGTTSERRPIEQSVVETKPRIAAFVVEMRSAASDGHWLPCAACATHADALEVMERFTDARLPVSYRVETYTRSEEGRP